MLKSENFNLAQIKVFNIVVFVKNNLKINSNNEFNSNVKALNLIDLYRYIEEKLKKYETTDFSSKYYENNITRIILKNNKYENIKNHKQQLSY